MFKTIKTIVIGFAIILVFITSSCLNPVDEEPIRTPQTEIEELNAALLKLSDEGYDIDTTDLGVYYIIREEGEGPLAEAGDTLNLEYSGFLLDGAIFDASSYHYTDGIWEFIFKDIQLIPGFDDGISLMNKGCEIDIIIPSELAYGSRGAGSIKPYSTLLFSAKMHDLKPRLE